MFEIFFLCPYANCAVFCSYYCPTLSHMSALYFSIRINRIASFQWINRELKRLEKEINLAHEKGWHKEYPLQIDADIMS
jgi:hypothetical protein